MAQVRRRRLCASVSLHSAAIRFSRELCLGEHGCRAIIDLMGSSRLGALYLNLYDHRARRRHCNVEIESCRV